MAHHDHFQMACLLVRLVSHLPYIKLVLVKTVSFSMGFIYTNLRVCNDFIIIFFIITTYFIIINFVFIIIISICFI